MGFLTTNLTKFCFNQTIARIPDSDFDSSKIIERQLSSRGGPKTKLLSFKDAVEFMMILPGSFAKGVRKQFADIITRYAAGDKSLHKEIDANAESSSPIAEMARAAVGIEPEDQESRRKRVRQEEQEFVRRDEEIQQMRIKNMENALGLLSRIRPDWQQTDTRFRLQTEDMIKNIIAVPSGSKALTNGEPARPASLSISQLAQELKLKPLKHGDNCRIGALAAKRYRGIHNNDPPKHRQWVDGAERTVSSYTEEDREMLMEVLRDLGYLPSSANSSVAGDDEQ